VKATKSTSKSFKSSQKRKVSTDLKNTVSKSNNKEEDKTNSTPVQDVKETVRRKKGKKRRHENSEEFTEQVGIYYLYNIT